MKIWNAVSFTATSGDPYPGLVRRFWSFSEAGDRKGQHSIRINDQFRICFVWKDGEAEEVEVVDYH